MTFQKQIDFYLKMQAIKFRCMVKGTDISERLYHIHI